MSQFRVIGFVSSGAIGMFVSWAIAVPFALRLRSKVSISLPLFLTLAVMETVDPASTCVGDGARLTTSRSIVLTMRPKVVLARK